jgi:hypothetical protein
MENNVQVYRHIRLDKNEPFYIGIGRDNRPTSKKDRNKWWKNVTNKSDYRVDILFTNLSWEEACKKEIELIQLYGRRDLGLGTLVNMTNGGEGNDGYKHTKDAIRKISQASLGNTYASGNKDNPKSKEHRENISKAMTGFKRPPMTDEHRIKLSKAHEGRIVSKETRAKISKIHKGKTISMETRNKLSDSKIANNGYHIVCVETGEKYDSLKTAGKANNVSYQAIRQSIINNHKCKGYTYLRINE